MRNVFMLTAAGAEQVQSLDATFDHIKKTGIINAHAAFQRTTSRAPQCLRMFVVGQADHADLRLMVEQGYATWLEIDDMFD